MLLEPEVGCVHPGDTQVDKSSRKISPAIARERFITFYFLIEAITSWIILWKV